MSDVVNTGPHRLVSEGSGEPGDPRQAADPPQPVSPAKAVDPREFVASSPAARGLGARGRRPLLRKLVGDVLRRIRLKQVRTLAEVARDARVSIQYLSEVERGRKEASSEVLAAVCEALRIELGDLLAQVSQDLAAERAVIPMDAARRRHHLEAATRQRSTAPRPAHRPGDVVLLVGGGAYAGIGLAA